MSMQPSHSMQSLVSEHRLHVAVEAALHFLFDLLRGEAELDFDFELLEASLGTCGIRPPLPAWL